MAEQFASNFQSHKFSLCIMMGCRCTCGLDLTFSTPYDRLQMYMWTGLDILYALWWAADVHVDWTWHSLRLMTGCRCTCGLDLTFSTPYDGLQMYMWTGLDILYALWRAADVHVDWTWHSLRLMTGCRCTCGLDLTFSTPYDGLQLYMWTGLDILYALWRAADVHVDWTWHSLRLMTGCRCTCGLDLTFSTPYDRLQMYMWTGLDILYALWWVAIVHVDWTWHSLRLMTGCRCACGLDLTFSTPYDGLQMYMWTGLDILYALWQAADVHVDWTWHFLCIMTGCRCTCGLDLTFSTPYDRLQMCMWTGLDILYALWRAADVHVDWTWHSLCLMTGCRCTCGLDLTFSMHYDGLQMYMWTGLDILYALWQAADVHVDWTWHFLCIMTGCRCTCGLDWQTNEETSLHKSLCYHHGSKGCLKP